MHSGVSEQLFCLTTVGFPVIRVKCTWIENQNVNGAVLRGICMCSSFVQCTVGVEHFLLYYIMTMNILHNWCVLFLAMHAALHTNCTVNFLYKFIM